MGGAIPPFYGMISAVQTHTTMDFHNTSLNAHEYWEMQQDKEEALAIANLNTSNCWQHDGFMDFYRDVCDSATKQAQSPYGGFDYDGAFDDGTPLEMIIEAYQDGDSAAETAEALLQGEAEQAAEDIVRDGGIF